MKQTINGQKVQNWHRPLAKDELRQRYLKHRDGDPHFIGSQNNRGYADDNFCNYWHDLEHYDYSDEENEYYRDDQCYPPYYGYCDYSRDRAPDCIDDEERREIQVYNHISDILNPLPLLASQLNQLPLKTIAQSESNSEYAPHTASDLLAKLHHYNQLYCNRDLIRLTRRDRLSPSNIAVIKQAYPNSTSTVESICLLAEFWLRSPVSWNPQQTPCLLDHIFVRYPVPQCLYHCWQEGFNSAPLDGIIIFLLYAQGGSLKQATKTFDWKVKNHKLWSHLNQCPASLSFDHAIIYAEIMRLGGTKDDFEAIIENKSYAIKLLVPDDSIHSSWDESSQQFIYSTSNQKNIDFWYDMVTWFIRYGQNFIDIEKAQLLSWARHRYTESQQQSFSMKGRSVSKVNLQIANYYNQLARAKRQWQNSRSWKAKGWSWKYTDKKNKVWKFTELTSAQALNDEPNTTKHCVAMYSYDCYRNNSVIISLTCDTKRKVTIEVNPRTKHITQAQGSYNREITAEENTIISQWMNTIVNKTKKAWTYPSRLS